MKPQRPLFSVTDEGEIWNNETNEIMRPDDDGLIAYRELYVYAPMMVRLAERGDFLELAIFPRLVRQ